MSIKVGDAVGFVFGGPGPDITYLLVLEIEKNLAKCWDVCFDFPIEINLSNAANLWLATDRDLDSSMGFHTSKRNGSFTIRALIEEARAAHLNEVSR